MTVNKQRNTKKAANTPTKGENNKLFCLKLATPKVITAQTTTAEQAIKNGQKSPSGAK